MLKGRNSFKRIINSILRIHAALSISHKGSPSGVEFTDVVLWTSDMFVSSKIKNVISLCGRIANGVVLLIAIELRIKTH